MVRVFFQAIFSFPPLGTSSHHSKFTRVSKSLGENIKHPVDTTSRLGGDGDGARTVRSQRRGAGRSEPCKGDRQQAVGGGRPGGRRGDWGTGARGRERGGWGKGLGVGTVCRGACARRWRGAGEATGGKGNGGCSQAVRA